MTWVALAPPAFWTADGAALANSAALTAISPTPDVTIPGNTLYIGSRFRVLASGRFSTTGAPTLNLGLYYGGSGGVALCTTGALTTVSGAATLTWWFEALVDIRTLGATGTAMATGRASGITVATAVAHAPASAPPTATIDTTASKALVLGATWGTAAAGNTITVHQWLVEYLTAGN